MEHMEQKRLREATGRVEGIEGQKVEIDWPNCRPGKI